MLQVTWENNIPKGKKKRKDLLMLRGGILILTIFHRRPKPTSVPATSNPASGKKKENVGLDHLLDDRDMG